MKHQRCRLCGEEHRLGPCPSSKAVAAALEAIKAPATPNPEGRPKRSRKAKAVEPGDAQPATDASRRVQIPASGDKKKRAPRGTFDRQAYQRDYMRRKAAAKKDAGHE